MKIKKSLYDEFFTTDSIKRKNQLRGLIEDALHAYMVDYCDGLQYWCMSDAECGEIGLFENHLTKAGVLVEYDASWFKHPNKPQFTVILFDAFIDFSG